MNSCNFYGRIASDIDMKYNESTTVASFSLAVNKRGKDKGADFFRMKAFNKQAEVLEKFFHKGSRIAVTATAVQPPKYTNKDGNTIYPNVEFFVNGIDFVDTKNETAVEIQEQPKQETPKTDSNGFMSVDDGIADDDLPFK